MAKGDSSTIDSFRLPLQTSINEWEFKYDFIPKTSEPKVPPVTQEAVKQDIAIEKAKHVERELFTKEANSSVKVEANSAAVIHGGESVSDEPEFLQDRGSKPIDVSKVATSHQSSKPANRDKYLQTSINPNINNSDVISLGENEVDHKSTTIDKQTQVIDDVELDHMDTSWIPKEEKKSRSKVVAVPLILGAGLGYYFFGPEKKTAAWYHYRNI